MSDILFNVQYDAEKECMVISTATPVRIVETPENSHANYFGFVEPVRSGTTPTMDIPNPDPSETPAYIVRAGWQTKAIYREAPPHYTAVRLDMLGVMADYFVALGSGSIAAREPLLGIRPVCVGREGTLGCDQSTVHGGPYCWRCGLNIPEIPELAEV